MYKFVGKAQVSAGDVEYGRRKSTKIKKD